MASMNDYHKKVILSVETDKESVKAASEEIAKQNKINLSKIFEEIGSSLKTEAKDAIGDAFDYGSRVLKKTFTDAWEELDNVLSYSLMTNREVRDLKLSYGFSSAEAYGFSRAQEALGISSEEDLFYMSDIERRHFQEIMTSQSEKYASLYDSGFFNEMLEYNLEMKELKQDLQLEIVDFYVDNKDLIVSAFHSILGMFDIVGKIANFLGDTYLVGNRSANASDYTNSYNKSTTVTVDNTYNGISQEDKSWMAQQGELTYVQLIKALKEE